MKTVQNVKNSLKFKAEEKAGVLTVKVGVKKYTLPVSARMLTSNDFLFLSFPASSELYRVQGAELQPMEKGEDAQSAFSALNPGRRRGRAKRSPAQLPDDVASILKAIPDGYRIGYNADGSPKLVRTRQRRRATAAAGA